MAKYQYEMMFILLPGLGDDGTKKELEEVREQITSLGGDIYAEDIWGHRDLAYRIKGHDSGYYAVFNFHLEGGKLEELEKNLNIHQPIIRYMIIKTPANYELVTLKEYEKAMEAEREEKEKAAKEEKEKRTARKPAKKPAPKPKKEEPKKEDETSTKEADKKLESIIDDPDISL